MQIVIDVSEEVKEDFIKKGLQKGVITQAIENGTLLPKGHGRLIDAGALVDKLNENQIEGSDTYKGLGEAKQIVINALTIIEADNN